MRVSRGLPFACWDIIRLLFDSALARTQRDFKVTICHYILMANHIHMVVVAHDSEQIKDYYTELQKKLTDAIKRLVGASELSLWEGRPMAAEILDIEEGVERISYFYANPAKANLVESIEQYPGVSTWEYSLAGIGITSSSSRDIPWVRLPMIKKLPSLELTETQDRYLTNKLRAKCKITHSLEIKPNSWMFCFGVTKSHEVQEIRDRIVSRTKEMENEHREERTRAGKKCLSAARLRRQGITWDHKPLKKERKIFVLSSVKELRIAYIKYYKHITNLARDAYKAAIRGLPAVWPPGTFRPPMPPLANAIGDFF